MEDKKKFIYTKINKIKYHNEIINYIKNNDIKYTENTNGFFVNISLIDEHINNIYNILQYIIFNNNEKPILPTLRSRCLIFKINLTFEQSVLITNKILKKNLLDLINYDLISYYNTPGEIINLINFSEEKNINLKDCTLVNFLNLLIENRFYKKNGGQWSWRVYIEFS